MSVWEYKIISSGKGGFASPALLEKFLNDLGREEWEIVEFRTQADNVLAFSGLARRPTQRDWTLEDAAAAAAKAETEKLRAEFEAKFKAATTSAAEPAGASFLEEKVSPDDGFRKPVDTSHDADADLDEEEAKADEWDKLTAAEDDDLPTFFDAIKPHMRRNQRGPGMSVGVDYLAKKWDQSEDDLKGALAECGFAIPEDEDAKAEYLEYDGDLYWINVNRRGELWINTKEKPRPVFKTVKAQKVAVEEPEVAKQKTEDRGQKADGKGQKREDREPKTEASGAEAQSGEKAEAAPAAAGGPLPQGSGLLDKIRPHMRRNRRGPGGSGSTSFLARALKTTEAELKAAFQALGLTLPASPNDKPVYTEIGNHVWWLNLDSRGGLWINGREKREGETIAAPARETGEAPAESAPGAAAPDAVPAPEVAPSASTGEASEAGHPQATQANLPPASQPERGGVLGAVRLLLKETRTGAFAGKVERLAEELGKSPEEFVATLVGAGLKVPEKSREKPVFVEHAGEIFWFNKNAKDELWLNAKPSKFADKKEDGEGGEGEAAEVSADGEKKPRRSRGRKKSESAESPEGAQS